jgi:hypothetical protein
VADRVKVNEALHALDITTGPALLFPGGHLQYDERGRRIGAKMVMVQWQNGAAGDGLSAGGRQRRGEVEGRRYLQAPVIWPGLMTRVQARPGAERPGQARPRWVTEEAVRCMTRRGVRRRV